MKLTKTIALSTLAFSMMAAQAAQADEPFINPDWANSAVYIGAGIGQSRASIDEQRIRSALTANGASVIAFNTDERETGYKLFIGKRPRGIGSAAPGRRIGDPGTCCGRTGHRTGPDGSSGAGRCI